ncbi:dUTP diphosphatase [Oceanicoccus sagamiensis]|uniref:dUTP diphosphatase n=1 Tax=Oceanicoccus sagamiensis TaxID=716816 RepID=A0A1X9ND75_9GAMM|nr:dUTP diphosphatase [Oceanicoccus sagamiensis]ARN75516.1 dUTP diphosphatase [Oceanicoccus sagamiensis]
MKQAFVTMLGMQDKMNQKVHADWITQRFEWYRAIWIECGELVEHYGYKWWKKQDPDMDQVKLEVIDIWHFGMSALFTEGETLEDIAELMQGQLIGYQYEGLGVREATEALAQDSLESKGFSVSLFWDLLNAVEMDFDDLYRQYVGKNVLNFFRQDNGYKEGTYIKQWQGREDNEHLVEILAELDSAAADYSDTVYQSLQQRYQSLTA